MSSGITVTSARHEAALLRLMSTSRRTAADILAQRARIVFRTVARYTPPASAGTLGRAAQTRAKAKIAGDIYGLYGTPGDAFDEIKDKAPGEADAFWWLQKHGDTAGASDILRRATGSIIAPFDGGTHHRRNFRRRGNRFRFYVTDPTRLRDYIGTMQDRIFWLASGWAPALQALKVKGIPFGVGKHRSPGTLRVENNPARIAITMTNRVGFAPNVKDIRRRILWAMNLDADNMQRAWEYNLRRLAGTAGMKKR